MNDGNILMTTMNGVKQAREDYKKFLYARAIHSSHVIQYHMQQILEQHKVVNKYRSMMEDRMDLIPLESNLYKSDPVVISHIIHMIEADNFWHQQTFEAVLADLWRNHDKEIHKHENETLHCTENEKTHEEMDKKEVISLCSESQTTTSGHCKGEESKKQENCNMEESKTIIRLESEKRPEKDFQAQEIEEDEVVMMCCKNSEGSLVEEFNKVTDIQDGRADNKMQKSTDEEEHVDSTLHMGNQLKILIEEFSWGMEDNASMLNTQETAQ